MIAAGTSRPASGGEHEISHAIDEIFGGRALHGAQVAFGCVAAHIAGDGLSFGVCHVSRDDADSATLVLSLGAGELSPRAVDGYTLTYTAADGNGNTATATEFPQILAMLKTTL